MREELSFRVSAAVGAVGMAVRRARFAPCKARSHGDHDVGFKAIVALAAKLLRSVERVWWIVKPLDQTRTDWLYCQSS
jgi:hypothetical protein